MSNKFCGPDIVKFFSVESAGNATGSTGDFNVCNGVTFVKTLSGCTNNININGNTFYNTGNVLFNYPITACTGIHTSNLYGCSPITIHDNLQSNGSNAGGLLSLAFGNNVTTTASYSHAEGKDTSARATGSHAEGDGTTTNGLYSHAEGFQTRTIGNYSHAEGYQTLTSGFTSNTQGRGTIAYGDYSYAGGFLSKARGNTSFIHSTNSIVLGSRSVVLGGENLTGFTDDTVYVPYLNINNLESTQAINNLGIDSDGNVVVGFSDGIYVTGGTYNSDTDTITLTRNDGVEIPITGVTDTFTTGGTYDYITKLITFEKNDGTSYDVDLSAIEVSGVTHTYTTGFTYDNANTFTISRYGGSDLKATINSVTGLTVNGNLVVSGDTNLQSLTTTDIKISETPQIDDNSVLQLLTRDGSTSEVKIKPIPNTINYGLFSQTGDSVTIVNTTTETSIIDGGVGTLSVPANAFKIGDSFRVVMGGILSNLNNNNIRIRLKADSIVLADSGTQPLVAHTNDNFKLEVDFAIRNIGGAGTASIITLGTFQTVKKNSSSITGFGFDFTNNTTFDTTIPNTLDITVQWSTASASNSIKSQVFTLTKTY